MERATFQRLNSSEFKQRFVYAFPEHINSFDGIEETLEYMSHLREIVCRTIESFETNNPLSIGKRVELFRIEEVDFLREYMGIYEVLENARKLSFPKYYTEDPTRSAIFDIFDETELEVKLFYMNIQPDLQNLKLICIRGRRECIIGLMTPEEIAIFIDDYEYSRTV